MGNVKSISTQVFDELFAAVDSIGVEKTIKALKDAKTSHFNQDIDFDFILNSVSELTGVDKERILFGNDRSDERKKSVSLLIFYLKNEFHYSFGELKKILKKDESSIYRYYSNVNNLPKSPKTDFDKDLTNISKKLNIKITEKKAKNGK
jgi:hypothetical protein